MSSKDQSVAPKERINVTYSPDTGSVSEEKELPLKLLMVGDYTQREDDTPLEQRESIKINKENFSDVMASQNLTLDMTVNDLLSGEEDEKMELSLDIKGLNDFRPENIVDNVKKKTKDGKETKALSDLLELRKSLVSLKGPLANIPAFRKQLQSMIEDDGQREQILKELGLEEA